MDAVQISCSAASNLSTVSASGLQPGHLVNTKVGAGTIAPGGGSWQSIGYTYRDVTDGDGRIFAGKRSP